MTSFADLGLSEDLLKAVADNGLTVEKIWITHGHMDHAGGAADVKAATGAPIEGPHRDDQFWIDGIEAAGLQYGVAGAKRFTPDRWLEDGDTVTLGETTWQVRHCPGHTPGHVVFIHEGGSIGRTDFPRGNHADLIKAITTRLWPLGEDIAFVPGHGPMSTFGAERRSNPFVADHVLA